VVWSLGSLVSLVSFVSIFVSVPSAAQQGPVFRGGVDLVSLGITVTDRKGTLVTDLKAEDFEVVEDGKKQTISEFGGGRAVDLENAARGSVTADGSAPAMHLGLLLDVSESMGEDIAFTKTAAIRFLKAFTEAIDVTVVDFDTEVRVARYKQSDFARVVDRIRQQKARGSTALYDAIAVYLDGASAEEGRKVMLMYTDGGDTTSATRYRELIDLLKASNVTVYVIGQIEHETQSGRNQQRFILQQIGDTTGGQAFFPISVRDLDSAYDSVLKQIRAQYVLGYQSTNAKTDGAWRKLEIKVVTKGGAEYRVRARKGYFAPYKKP
jgi:Ca-activated chloride channel family protein